MSDEITVRAGTETDLGAIFQLVRELAIYEEAENEVITSEAQYIKDFTSGWFNTLVATRKNGEIVGMMLFYKSYSTWKGPMLFLEDFVVKKSYRRLGVGSLLWSELKRKAKMWGCTSMKWQVLDWNMPAKDFYKKIGAELEENWENGRLYF